MNTPMNILKLFVAAYRAKKLMPKLEQALDAQDDEKVIRSILNQAVYILLDSSYAPSLKASYAILRGSEDFEDFIFVNFADGLITTSQTATTRLFAITDAVDIAANAAFELVKAASK